MTTPDTAGAAGTEEQRHARGPKSILQTLRELQFGHFEDECTQELRKVLTAIARTDKKGSLTIVLSFKPGKGGQVEVESTVTAKIPQEEKGTSLMFIGSDLNLQRNDPRQTELPGMRVATDRGAAVRLDDEARAPGMRVS